jgi:predicted nuclease of predicted toxin-antitoxin system
VRFLVDECTGPAVAAWLRAEHHEVFSVYEEARGATDDDVLSKAHDEGWILITNDKDFGEMVRRAGRPHCGIIFLRLHDERAAAKIDALRKLLASHADQLPGSFVVVTEAQIRFGVT